MLMDFGRLMLGFLVLYSGLHILQTSAEFKAQHKAATQSQVWLYDSVFKLSEPETMMTSVLSSDRWLTVQQLELFVKLEAVAMIVGGTFFIAN